MSGIAEVLLNLGYFVSGSDLVDSEATRRLRNLGGRVVVGHSADNLKAADVVVISSAVREDNPEVISAMELGVPVIQRAEMLAELMRMKYGIAVAGSHGKTTATSMLAAVLASAGLDPTLVIGGRLNSLGSNAHLGQGEFLVAEADESDGSFLRLTPTYSIITNIDPEHLDYYGDEKTLKKAFIEFANKVPFYGMVAVCQDHPGVAEILPFIGKRFITYGMDAASDYQAVDLQHEVSHVRFTVVRHGVPLGSIALQMIGEHNVLNALGAVVIADELQVPFGVSKKALQHFEGIERRFTVRGEENGITVVDDYAHHPVEIRATLAGAKKAYQRRMVVVFQPHRYTRTRDLAREFYSAFDRADLLAVMDIYPAGEKPIEGVSAKNLYKGIRNQGPRQVQYIPQRQDVVRWLMEHARPGDLVITLGAGDVWKVGSEFLEHLKATAGGSHEA
jgi:UDP-N-acetylmuramate--alanine ligase